MKLYKDLDWSIHVEAGEGEDEDDGQHDRPVACPVALAAGFRSHPTPSDHVPLALPHPGTDSVLDSSGWHGL